MQRLSSLLVTLAILLSLAGTALADRPVAQRYYLVLDRAMYGGDNVEDYRELVLDLEKIGELWGPVYGISRNYNMANAHRGAVQSATLTDDAVKLELLTDITPDKWVDGGQGTYTLDMKRERDGNVLSGTFEGEFRGRAVKGKAWGWVFDAEPVVENFKPLEPQEHPRLLFRKSDLPALKDKAKTPLGQVAMKKMEQTAVGMGVLYQLTSDEKWADQSMERVKKLMAGNEAAPGWYGTAAFTKLRPVGGRIEQTAFAYDLCYHAWPEEFKAEVRSWLTDMAYSVFFAPEALGTTNWNVQSNHVGIVYAGIGEAGLAMFDEPSPKPTPPSEPFTTLELPPARDYTPGKGVPVTVMTPGKSPTDWLVTKPLRKVTPDDPRANFYGLEDVRPEPGTEVKVGDFDLTFQPIPDDLKSEAEFGGVHIGHLLESGKRSKEPLTLVFYSVLDVQEPGLYKVFNPSSRANLSQIALNGKLLAPEQVVKLDKGLYPLMAMIQFRIKWDETAPHLIPATQEDVTKFAPVAEDLRSKYEARRLNYDAEVAQWEAAGGANPAYQRMFRLGRWYMFLQARYAVGTGGFQSEVGHYSYDTTDGLNRYAPAYRRMFGYDVSPFNDIAYFVPRKIIGGPQDINGTTNIGYAYFASLFPMIPDRWQPEVLAAWRQDAGLDPLKNDVDTAAAGKLLDRDGVQGFLNYPLDMKPQPVGTDLPQSWQAEDFGYYAGRSSWGGDATIAQVFLKSMPIHGWSGPNAGTFRLRGLGQNWATGSTGRQRTRFQESVVWLPENEINEGGLGNPTYYKGQDDGSFIVSVNLDEVYGTAKEYTYSKYGRVRLPGDPEKIGETSDITGSRSIAFDYSGKSGVPCLVVIVDKINGGGKKLWLWQTEGAPEARVTPSANGFTIKGDDEATLKGRFITPGKVYVAAKSRKETFVKAGGHGAGVKTFQVDINAISVEGSDGDGEFFFVGTLSPDGNHPAIDVKGKGLDAVITVGKQTVRFDGEKIVLGE